MDVLLVTTDCESHGTLTSLLMVFDDQNIDEVANCPPVCPKCEHIDGPQADIVKLSPLKRTHSKEE